jgi:antitoxin PrlF
MPTLLMSSKGQLVLPAALRKKLGLHAGSRLEVLEEADGLKLRVLRAAAHCDVTQLAGMVKAHSSGQPRRLEDFDPASPVAKAAGRRA